MPNFVILEEIAGRCRGTRRWSRGRYDGSMAIGSADAPGLGVEVDEKVAARHPFEQEQIASMEAVLRAGRHHRGLVTSR